MKNTKPLIVCILMSLFTPVVSFSQQCSIDVSTQIVNAKDGASSGSITFLINNSNIASDNHYAIFFINAINGERASQTQLKNGFVGSLSKGLYEFLVVDKKRGKCFKEIQVEIKENIEK